MKKLAVVLSLTVASIAASPLAQAKTLQFGGYTWTVRNSTGGPGPNTFDENNVWLDDSGALHLKISHSSSGWTCAELYTNDRLGFGSYQWYVTGQIDQLDDNVVFGLFPYPTSDVGPDTTNEIDIEFARWGNASYPNGNYTIYPTSLLLRPASSTFNFSLNGNQTTQRIDWTSQSITLQSLAGFTDGNDNAFGNWTYAPRATSLRIAQQPMPLHMNLWLFNGQPPKNNQEVEIVINAFKYTAP